MESSGRFEFGFHLFDGIHNVRQLTDNSQVVTDKYAFDAWGNTTSSTAAWPTVSSGMASTWPTAKTRMRP